MRFMFLALFVLMGASQSISAKTTEENVFTLIRNNHVNPLIRVHIATFDTANGSVFNARHCQKAQEYFQKAAKELGSVEKLWCEKGYFKE